MAVVVDSRGTGRQSALRKLLTRTPRGTGWHGKGGGRGRGGGGGSRRGWRALWPVLFKLGPMVMALAVAVSVALGLFKQGGVPGGAVAGAGAGSGAGAAGAVSPVQIGFLAALWVLLMGYCVVLYGFLRHPDRLVQSGDCQDFALLPAGRPFLRLGLLSLSALIPTIQFTGFPFSTLQPLYFLLLAVVATLWGKRGQGPIMLGAFVAGALCLIGGEFFVGGVKLAPGRFVDPVAGVTGMPSGLDAGVYLVLFGLYTLFSMIVFRLSLAFRDWVRDWAALCNGARDRLILGQEAAEFGLDNLGGVQGEFGLGSTGDVHELGEEGGELSVSGGGTPAGESGPGAGNGGMPAVSGDTGAHSFDFESDTSGGGSGLSRSGTFQTREMNRINQAVGAIKQSIETVLGLLHESLSLNTCALLWLSSGGDKFRVRAGVCNSNRLRQDPFNAREGLPGSVLAQNERVIVSKLKFGFKGLSYYHDGDEVRSFMGLPVRLRDGRIGGVLVLDKRADDAFDDRAAEKAEKVIQFILRAMENERNLMVSEKARIVQERFHGALKSLNSALEPDQVYEAALKAVGRVVPYDFGALTLYDRSSQKHLVVRVSGPGEDKLSGLSFRDNAGLVSQVTRSLHHMPVGQITGNSEDTVLFIPQVRLKGFASFLVLPLPFGEQAIGTLCLAAREPNVFTDEVRQRLEVVASAVAISIENARNYARVMEMATTDGLTGLCNHRQFQNLFDQYLARAKRSNKKMAFILGDIDFFKKVNDTYGHPAGDEVLKNVARVLAKSVREVDTVARYGGEEFAILLEDTDGDGAFRIAERMRLMVAASPVNWAGEGVIKVTLSLGIAQFPDDGEDKATLIQNADAALYQSKENGRNRVTLAAKPGVLR